MGSSLRTTQRIVFLTGTRADFGKIKSLIRALRAKRPQFEVHIFVTGMHMDPQYGYTVEEVEKCGFDNIYRYINAAGADLMDRSLASTVQGFGDYVRLTQPDLIVVHGDRVEALAGALVGSINNILVAHIEGGEVSGTIDELIRHSVSKLSHLHFVANDRARCRLVQLGEEPRSIFVIGSPDVDIMTSPELPSLEEVKAHYEIPFDRYGILAYHPVTTLGLHEIQRETQNLVEALGRSDLNWIAIYPNNDRGSQVIREEYARVLAGWERVRIFPSIRFEAMLVLLRHTQVVLGNSSMGIREAPYYGVPTVNVGTRQNGRTDNPQIVHVTGEPSAIQEGIQAALNRTHALAPVREFGQGDSHLRFRQVLEREDVWQTPVQKKFRDLPPPAQTRDEAA